MLKERLEERNAFLTVTLDRGLHIEVNKTGDYFETKLN
jgi:hypothetical protein